MGLEVSSSEVQIQALYSADENRRAVVKHQLLIINLTSVQGGQLVNFQTTQRLERRLNVIGIHEHYYFYSRLNYNALL